ncbi:MAG: NADH-quinone oxidoreductase subunit L [Myxococcota bacterium]|jgi:NAD(P)H-quinone oxidoreductase subunit 5|nr:NADH-quinone oxidoreductase subunit L [Myxococcota bacterium]
MTSSAESALAAFSALAIPITLAVGALAARAKRDFGVAKLATSLALVATAVAVAATALAPSSATGATSTAHALGLRIDALTLVMLTLVTSLAAFLVRFSDRYLDGDPNRPRYVRWLLGTLASVTTLVITDHLLVLALAWTTTSLCLHQLLTFYEDRPNALVAAHQKFLVSRLADVCLLGAVALVYTRVGDDRLSTLDAHVAEHGSSAGLAVGATLVALAITLKSAQLPFHGWLLKVMEAPTPVSALLHAGVVNVGGFVAIRLCAWLGATPGALGLLVAVGSVTTVVGALAMKQQATVKSTLAWSTCAQMGFMLVQCGLGAWDLALLHLVAHSLYKAHAFCSSGHAVAEVRVASLVPHAKPSLSRVLAAAVIASVGLAALAHAWVASFDTTLAPSTLALLVFVGVSLAVPLAKVPTRALPIAGAFTLLFAALYFGWHALFAHLWPGAALGGPAWSLAVVALAALALLQAVIETRTRGVLRQLAGALARLGAELDARFTTAAFALWPPRVPSTPAPDTLIQPQEVN